MGIRTTKAEHERKRRIVAAGALAGKDRASIAAEAGCTVRHATRIANDPATRLLIADLMRPEHDRLRKMAHKAVAAVDRGLTAVNTRKRPIYETQLHAVDRFAELARLAQGNASGADDEGLVTWQQFILIYQSREQPAPPA